MKCSEHIPKEQRLPYLAWHSKAAETYRNGQRQLRCSECQLWFFPWERTP